MAWKNLSYKFKGIIIGVPIAICFGFLLMHSIWINILIGIVMGFFIGWFIESAERKEPATFMAFQIGLIAAFGIVFFYIYQCGSSQCFFFQNIIGSNKYVWIILSIFLSTLIGFIMDLFIGNVKRSSEHFSKILSCCIISIAIILFLGGAGYFISSPNASKCKFFSDDSDCYEGVASQKQDFKICNMIQSTSKRDKCYFNYVTNRYREPQLEICDLIQLKDIKDYCFNHIATTLKQIEICQRIQNQTIKDDCTSTISLSLTTNLDDCNELNNEDNGFQSRYKDKCIVRVAINTKEDMLCANLEDINSGDICYLEVAIEKSDFNLCYNINNEGSKNTCFQRVAWKTKDALICNNLEDPHKSACIKTVENIISGKTIIDEFHVFFQ